MTKRGVIVCLIGLLLVVGCAKQETETVGSGAPAGGEVQPPCRSLIPMFSPSAPEPSEQEGKEIVTRLPAEVPPELQADAALVVEVSGKVEAGDKLPEEDKPRVNAAMKRLLDWTAGHCPSGGPYWNCLTQASFRQIGPGVDNTGGPSTSAPASTPSAALAASPDGKEPVELRRSDEQVVFGYLDDAGRIERSTKVDRQSAGWVTGETSHCRKG